VDIRDVENILGLHRGLLAPSHVLICNEEVVEKKDGHTVFRGLQPKNRRDVIVLTPQADAETVVHETLHANIGLGENLTYPLAKILTIPRNWAKKTLGIFKDGPLLPRLIIIRYKKCSGCEEFRELHRQYGTRVEHYVRTG